MSELKNFEMLFSAVILLLISSIIVFVKGQPQVQWIDGYWARGCDFYGNDFTEAQMASEKCGGWCQNVDRCTHFVWYRGICYLKDGPINRDQVQYTGKKDMICGFIRSRTKKPAERKRSEDNKKMIVRMSPVMRKVEAFTDETERHAVPIMDKIVNRLRQFKSEGSSQSESDWINVDGRGLKMRYKLEGFSNAESVKQAWKSIETTVKQFNEIHEERKEPTAYDNMYGALTVEQYMWMGKSDTGPLSKKWFLHKIYKLPRVISVSFMVPSRDPDNMAMAGTLKLEFNNENVFQDLRYCHSQANVITNVLGSYIPYANHATHLLEVLCTFVHY